MTHFVTDDLEIDLHPLDEDGDRLDTTVDGFDWSEQSRVVIDNQPWADRFGTDEFHRFEATVARPIKQTYQIDGEEVIAKKLPEELQSSQWGLDNAPYVLGHPAMGVVTDSDDIHGFWRHPRYIQHDDEPDEQKLRLYVPTTDEEAKSFLEDTQSISVGFFGDFDFETDEEDIDAYQRNLRYDHVASVTQGRCSPEDGCQVSFGDAIQTASAAVDEDGDIEVAHGGCTTGDCSCGLHTTTEDEPTDTSIDMTDDNDNTTLDVGALSLDAIAERHDEVAALTDKKDALAAKKSELEEQKSALQDKVSDLEAELDQYHQSEREELVEELTDITDHWDEETMLDDEDGPSMTILKDRLDFAVEELAEETSTTTVGDGETHEPEGLGSETESDGATFMPDSARAGGLTDD